ncbi:hypothetical protein HDV04_000549 [Boothiomyces sp. JEL0838]|nr:hypothetical protein HDV04_000549 [Boothiomyces sp. JEL0838]
MVKRSDFKTCSQSAFCVRQQAIADYVDTTNNKIDWTMKSIQYAPNAITGQVDSLGDEFSFEFNILAGNNVRFRLHEKTLLHPRYEAKFSIETLETAVYDHQKKDGLEIVTFGSSELLIAYAPFSFEFKVNGKSQIAFNKNGYFYYEPYRAESKIPEFAVVKEGEGDEKLNEIKTKIGKDLGSESFGGKTDSKPRGASSIGFDITFPNSKHVFGIPEHATSYSLKSTRGTGAEYTEPYRLYNLDVFEYELDNPMALYGAVPFMLSHKVGSSAGFLWLNSAEMWIDVEKSTDPSVKTHWMAESGMVDLFFFLGPTQNGIFNSFTKITGRPQLPQQFATTYHQCRWNYNTEEDALEVDSNFDLYDIPYDVLWLDIEHTDGKRYFTWDKVKFPHPKEMQNKLANKGRKMITIIDPHIKKDDNYHVSKKAKELDIFVKNTDGSTFDGHCWPGDSNWIDYTNPKGREYWAEQFLYKNYEGSTPSLYTWNDMNEPSVFTGPEVTMPKDLLHYENVEHRDIHNTYGMLQHRSTFEGHLKRSDNKDRPFILSRAFFVGTQRYGAIWTGDNTGEWEHLSMSIPMLLSVSIAGITFCGADVGGFFLNPDAELLVRWYQLGALQPFFRAHAHIDTKRREPWLFGEPYTSLFREAVIRRYKLLPYIYTLFSEAHLTGNPVMRSMMQEFPDNELTFGMDDQYMFGQALLVKPVSKAGQTSVEVFLPQESIWYDYDTFELAKPKANLIKVETPLDKVPVFMRGGSIIPRKDRQRRSSQLMKKDPYTIIVALDSRLNASGSIYVDDGSSFEYQSGDYINSKFEFKDNTLSAKHLPLSTPMNVKGDFNVKIERIVIVGYSNEPAAIKNSNGKDLFFGTKKVGDSFTVTIKNPEVLIGDEWSIKFKGNSKL